MNEKEMTYEQHIEDACHLLRLAETQDFDRAHHLALSRLHLDIARELREAGLDRSRYQADGG